MWRCSYLFLSYCKISSNKIMILKTLFIPNLSQSLWFDGILSFFFWILLKYVKFCVGKKLMTLEGSRKGIKLQESSNSYSSQLNQINREYNGKRAKEQFVVLEEFIGKHFIVWQKSLKCFKLQIILNNNISKYRREDWLEVYGNFVVPLSKELPRLELVIITFDPLEN